MIICKEETRQDIQNEFHFINFLILINLVCLSFKLFLKFNKFLYKI